MQLTLEEVLDRLWKQYTTFKITFAEYLEKMREAYLLKAQ